MSPRAPRAGFTLVELLVALVVTGMIALVAYGALDAGTSTRARVQGPLRDRESALLARALLDDALRHAIDASDASDASGPALVFAHDAGASGDVLDVVTRGIAGTGAAGTTPSDRPFGDVPLGAAPRWRVRVEPGGAGDVMLAATPLDAPGPVLRMVLGGVRAVRVTTLGPGGWTHDAADVERVPDVVRVELLSSRGSEALPPVIARTAAGGPR